MIKKIFIFFLSILLIFAKISYAEENLMILKLKNGDVIIELFDDIAPNHVKRFKKLSNEKKYDGVVFHRVIDGFMAQTGDVEFGNSNLESYDIRRAGTGGSRYPDLKFNKKIIKVLSFNTLTMSLCRKYKATVIFRGLRVVSDFEYEFQLAGMNRKLDKRIETVFLMSDVDKQVISSKFVKEIAKLNGKIDNFVTKSTKRAIQNKI